MLRCLAKALADPCHLARVARAATSAPKRSSVAIILRQHPSGHATQILYVMRASSANDAWSGQVAFPGGRRQESDADDLAAAIRETHEEAHISLTVMTYL